MSRDELTKAEYWAQRGQGTVIALIHGIGAEDPKSYWKQFLSVLLLDKEIQGFGIFVWGYPTHLWFDVGKDIISSLRGKTLRNTAPSIEFLGKAWDTTYETQFHDYQQVILVCHSMGGLVVKSWIVEALREGRSAELSTLRHISFYATPHGGAPVTTLANWNKQLKDMQLDSPFIEDVGNRWYEHVVIWKDKDPGPSDRPCNRYIPHLVIAGINDGVVPPNFATIKGMRSSSVSGDHSQVIQPDNTDDTLYKRWVSDWERVHPISASSIEQRYKSRQVLQYAVRLIPKQDFLTSGFLGRKECGYVFVADYIEQRGRSLKQILNSLWMSGIRDPKLDPDTKWAALIFEVGKVNYDMFDPKPATWKAVFRILWKNSKIDPSYEEEKAIGSHPNYCSNDQYYWMRAVIEKVHNIPTGPDRENVLSSYFGLEASNFPAVGLAMPLDNSTGPSRVFFVKNVAITQIKCWTQELGSLDDEMILKDFLKSPAHASEKPSLGWIHMSE